MNRILGIGFGLLAAASFGLIPLFTLPLLHSGLRVDSILFYRFFFATLILACIVLVKRESFRITLRDFMTLMVLGLFYSSSAIFYFLSFKYMASGMATTIHFLYPVFVAIFMMCFFDERRSPVTIGAIVLAVSGVALLSMGSADERFTVGGLCIVLISSVANAAYIAGMSRTKMTPMSSIQLTFFLLFAGAVSTLLFTLVRGPFQLITDGNTLLHLLMLAGVTGAFSNLMLIGSISRIGSTLAAILGAAEPLTAVFVGVFVFHEIISTSMSFGIVLILTAVVLIILSRNIEAFFRKR